MTSKIKIETQWVEDANPCEAGVYLVALRHISGFGSYDFLFWDGKRWLNETSSKIAGWAANTELLNVIDADWPDSDKQIDIEFEKYQKLQKKAFEDDDFIEIE